MRTFFILLLGFGALLAGGFAQETAGEIPTFRTGVSDVRVDAQVVEGKKLLTGLTQYDFVVTDNGQPQKIVYFGHDAESLDLLLLLDVSGSMRKNLQLMASTAREALRFLKPRDRVGVMLFSKRTDVRLDLTENLGDAARAINDALEDHDLGAGTAINAAVLSAAAYMHKQTGGQGRRAILIVTDNLSLGYQTPDDMVIRALYGADTVLNAIVVGRGIRPAPRKPSVYVNPDFTPADVFLLAEQTGGEAVKSDRTDATFREMIERIRTRYSLHYHAPQAPSGSFRRIQVTLSASARSRYPRAEVRARNGYYVNRE